MARAVYLVAIGAVLTLLPGAGFAAELASHRALYGMTLHFARSGSEISSVVGKMAVEWSRTCAGWTFEHQSLIDVTFNVRDPVRLSTNATSWESLDGLQYRFSIRNLTNGKVTERVEGVAQLVASGGPGRVTFTAPKGRTMKLPAGTMFPARHSVELIALAARAPTMVTRTVFDGMSFDGAFQLSAALGAPVTRGADGGKELQALAGRRYWPVQLAFFPVASPAAAPEHEVGMHMYDNGISDELLVSFGEFTVRARLSKLEILKPRVCD